jgi:DNA invertase Pin-like site-specific DNA recombinase
MRVAIYARTSRAEKGDETSIPVQLADCRDRAATEGWDVVAESVDAGISGWKRKTRPGYERLYADAEAGRIDAVLVRDYERLLRSDLEGARWLDLYDRQGFGRFVFADEADINLARARDRKDFKDRVSAAVYYSDRLSEKVRKSKAAAKATGAYTGGEAEPYGYRRVDGTLQVDPAEAKVIHGAVARLAKGVAVGRVTSDLNTAGIPTSKGARWRPRSLRNLLLSEHLTGARGYPTILSAEEAALARTVLSMEERHEGPPPGRKHALSGLLRCADCGTNMAANTDSYRCTSAAGGCGGPSIRSLPLEKHVLLEALKHFLAHRAPGGGRPTPEPAPDPGALAELRQIERDLEDTRALVAEGTMRPADAAPILRRLAERQATAAERVSRTLQTTPEPPVQRLSQVFTADELRDAGLPARSHAEEFRLRWEAHDPAAVQVVRDLVQTQVERVTISRRVTRGRGFDTERVSIAWK